MNYSIEGGLNFIDELNSSIKESVSNDAEVCLIIYSKLDSNHITLECGHKYNYLPIYNEVVYQKTKTNTDIVKLGIKQIKCPYCRNIQNFLLPQMKGYNLIQGVNSPLKFCKCLYNCSYKLKTGICNKPCNEEFCTTHKNKNKNKILIEKNKKENRCKCSTLTGMQCKNIGVIEVENNITKVKCKICNIHNKKVLNLDKSLQEAELNNMLKYI